MKKVSKGSGICLLVVGIILSIFGGLGVVAFMLFSTFVTGVGFLVGGFILYIFLLGLGIVLIVVGIFLIKGSKRAGERPEEV